MLFASTDAWLHTLSVADTMLEPLRTKLVQLPDVPRTAEASSASVARVVGLDGNGAVVVVDVDVASTVVGGDSYSPLVVKDWPTALALRLDDNGDPVPFDP